MQRKVGARAPFAWGRPMFQMRQYGLPPGGALARGRRPPMGQADILAQVVGDIDVARRDTSRRIAPRTRRSLRRNEGTVLNWMTVLVCMMLSWLGRAAR
jgi:hypothetical protein